MKKLLFTISLFSAHLGHVYSQTTLTLQPNAANGKDAYVESRLSSSNFGNHQDFMATAWTNSGTPTTVRSLIDFDLTSIPSTATITSAYLSLYSYNSPFNGSHSTLSGPNDCVLQRITSSWAENTVTWDTQPLSTPLNQVSLSASTSSVQNYTNIDVTALVQDMQANPSSSFGFLIKLNTESYYRRMIFASSDNSDASLHPKLVVNYYTSVGINENELAYNPLNIYPNPTKENIYIRLNEMTEKPRSIEVINRLGQSVFRTEELTSNSTISINLAELNLADGIYTVNLFSQDKVYSKKVILNK